MREHYNNGDDITLQAIGCDGCSPSMVNGVLCHERGCPDKWRDYAVQCKWCNTKFYPPWDGQEFCCDCCTECYN